MARRNGEKKEESVAVAIDKDKSSQQALKWTVDHLLTRGQALTLLHVKQNPSSIPTPCVSSLLLVKNLFSSRLIFDLVARNKILRWNVKHRIYHRANCLWLQVETKSPSTKSMTRLREHLENKLTTKPNRYSFHFVASAQERRWFQLPFSISDPHFVWLRD